MASSRIKGITIEIGANTVQLTEQLAKVDKSLKDTQTQLKDVNKLLKFDPHNVELLTQKQDLLKKAVKDTEDKLKEEKKALEQLVANNDGSDKAKKQQEALRREIEDTTISLEYYQKQLRQTHPQLEAFASASAEVAEKTKILSQTAGAIGVAMLGNAVNAGRMADELNTLSRNTGISTDMLQQMNYAQDLVDVSTEQMAGAMKKLTQNMGNEADVFGTLGVNIRDANGELRNSEDVFFDTLKALSEIENETERDALAMKVFGKSAMDLSGIIDDGGEALRQYGQEAKEAGLILSEDALASANELNDTIDKLKATTQSSLLQAGASLAEVLAPALETIAEKLAVVLQWVAELDGEQQQMILTILAVVASISPLATMLSKVTSLVTGFNNAIAFISTPAGIAVLAIAGLITAGILLYKHWDELKEYAHQLKENLIENFESARDSVVGAFQTIIQWAVELPSRVANGILEQIGLVKSAAEQVGQGILDKISGFFEQAKTAGSDLIEEIKEGIQEGFNSIVDFLTGIGSSIVDGIWKGISNAVGKFTENVRGFFSGIVGSVKDELGIESPSKVFAYIGEMMGEGLTEGWDDAVSKFSPASDILAVTGGAALASTAGASYGFTNNINLYGDYHERDGMNIAMSIDRWLGERL